MPRIGQVNIVGVILATLAFFFVGFVFYGLLFADAWSRELLVWRGIVDPETALALNADELYAAMLASAEGKSAGLGMALGFLNALVTVIALAIARVAFKAFSLPSALNSAFWLFAGFAVTTLVYDLVYAGEPAFFFFIDGAHLLVAYLVSMTVLHFVD